MNGRVLVLSLLLFVPLLGRSQSRPDDDRQNAIDQVIELVSENLEAEELDFTTFLEDLQYFYNHPLNLNRATRSELQRLLILDAFQVEALLTHIAYSGKLLSIYELQGVDGFDLATIETILPFVKVSDATERHTVTWEGIKSESTHEMFVRYQRVLEEMEGYSGISDSALAASPNSRYLGGAERVLTRYRFRYLNNISVGITGEKDAGEEFFSGTQPQGFDFYSAHAYFGNYGALKHAIVGDYQVQFGQGLIYWTGLAFGKSASISSIKRTAREITPYVSADENNFMRGAATTVELGSWQVTGFVSNKRVDANITSIDSSAGDDFLVSEFSSFQTSGFHRTPAEVDDKDAVTEFNTGAHVRLVKDFFQIGVTGAFTRYSGNTQPYTQLYRQFEPNSNAFFVGGMDYQFMVRNVLGFGEVAQRSDGGAAFLNGAIVSLDPRLDISLLHRYYSPEYNNPRSNAISESSRNINEQGFYFGMAARLSPKWSFNGYYDLFEFPWLRFQADAPTRGKEYLAQLEYKPSKRFSAYARYRFEDKFEGYAIETQPTSAIGLRHRQWYRINWQFALSKTLSLRNRIELVQVDLPEGDTEFGWLLYQDVVFKPKWPARYQFKVRYALFDTDGYDSRIYAYEHDVLYSFSVPAYYYRGSRFYLIFGYDITRWSDLTVRFAQTYYSNRDVNGSSLNEVTGPTRSEIKVQLRAKF